MNLRTALPVLAAAGLAAAPLLPADAFSAPRPIEGLDSECLETMLNDCTVVSSGYTGIHDGPRIAFQIQYGYTEEDGIGGGVVLFQEAGERWDVLTTDFEGYYYDLPRLTDGEPILLHVAGVRVGSGSGNADLLFVYDEDADGGPVWREVDIYGWYDDIAELLPEGMEIWQGVDYDFGDWYFEDYNARTALWRSGDGNCCPSGGRAIIHFDLVGHALVAREVDYLPPAEAQ